MSLLAWIALGLIAGFVASNLVHSTGQGLLRDIVLGICGAVVGGYLVSALGATSVTSFNPYGILVAIVGAIVVLWIYHTVGRGSV